MLSSFIKTGADCVGGELRALNDHNIIAKAIELMQNVMERRWPFGANVAYKKEVMEKVGGFNEKMERGEDAELFLRVKKSGLKCVMSMNVSARTLNPGSLWEFFKQRFRWGMGFAQLTERHKEAFTTRIKLCFISTSLVLLSLLFVLIDGKLILIFPILLVLNVLRSVPLDVKIARKTKDTFHSLFIPLLRFINRIAYLLGWAYWKILELMGKQAKLEAFSLKSL